MILFESSNKYQIKFEETGRPIFYDIEKITKLLLAEKEWLSMIDKNIKELSADTNVKEVLIKLTSNEYHDFVPVYRIASIDGKEFDTSFREFYDDDIDLDTRVRHHNH